MNKYKVHENKWEKVKWRKLQQGEKVQGSGEG